MKVLLYAGGLKVIGVSGLGKAILHQENALASAKVEFTRDEKATDYDIAHINTYFLKSYFFSIIIFFFFTKFLRIFNLPLVKLIHNLLIYPL